MITTKLLLVSLFTLERAVRWTSGGRKGSILPRSSWQDTLTNSYGSCLEVAPPRIRMILLDLVLYTVSLHMTLIPNS